MEFQVHEDRYPHVTNRMDPRGLYQLMKAHLEWMAYKHYSERTIDSRHNMLMRFMDWCGQRDLIRPTEITKPIIERYQRHLFYYRKDDGKPLSIVVQRKYVAEVKQWFKWLTRENYILYNPASEVELPRAENRLPKAVLTESEVEKVMSAIDLESMLGIRDRAIVEVLYSTGMRRHELAQLKLDNLDLERGTIMIREGKGRKDRIIPIGDRAIHWVELYLNQQRPELSCGIDEGEVFLSRKGQRINLCTLSLLVGGYVKKAKLNKAGSCHLFRHTVATLMLEGGADIRYIQAMLGHTKLETTQIYTQVSIKALKEVHTRTHPGKSRKAKQPQRAPQEGEQELLEALWEESEEV